MKDSFLIGTPVVHPVYGEGRIVEIRPGSKNPVAVKFVGGITVDFKFNGKLSLDDPKTLQLNIKVPTTKQVILDCLIYILFILLGLLTGLFIVDTKR